MNKAARTAIARARRLGLKLERHHHGSRHERLTLLAPDGAKLTLTLSKGSSEIRSDTLDNLRRFTRA